jgi:galactonate dehydratase
MKITAVDALVCGAGMRNWVFVKVTTDEGVVGWGEASREWRTRSVVAALEDLRPLLVGEDPVRREHLWQVLYRQHYFRPSGAELSAVSGVDQALWDIAGKSAGLPVHRLLGGPVRDHVRTYDHLAGGDTEAVYDRVEPQAMAEAARRCVEDGYDAIKVLVVPPSRPLDSAASVRAAVARFAAIREAVGEDTDVMVDLHGRCSPAMALQYARALAPMRPWFFEEPIPPENPRVLADLRRRLPVPVATGERLGTRHAFREVLEAGAADVLQPDVCHCGGISEARAIASMAAAWHVAIAPHNSLGPVAFAAAIQLAFATPNHLIQEAFRLDADWRQEVVDEPIAVERGRVLPPTRPGLGVEVLEDVVAAHPPTQEPLMRAFHADAAVADW